MHQILDVSLIFFKRRKEHISLFWTVVTFDGFLFLFLLSRSLFVCHLTSWDLCGTFKIREGGSVILHYNFETWSSVEKFSGGSEEF